MSYWHALEREARALPASAEAPPRALFEPAPGDADSGLFEVWGEEEPVFPAIASDPLPAAPARAEPAAELPQGPVSEPANSLSAPPAASPLPAPLPVADLSAARAPLAEAPAPAAPAAMPAPDHTPLAAAAEPPPVAEPAPAPVMAALPLPPMPEPAPVPAQPAAAEAATGDLAAPPPPAAALPVSAEPLAGPPNYPEYEEVAPAPVMAADPGITIEIGEIHIRLVAEEPAAPRMALRSARTGSAPSLDSFLARGEGRA